MRTIREYLYKAKTEMIVRSYNNGLDDGIWVKGYLRCDCGMWLIYQFEYDRADQVAYEVNPETICQFTGFTDSNGDKIWENDIVEIIWYSGRKEKYLLWWSKEMSMMEAISINGICFNENDYWGGKPDITYEDFCLRMQDPWGDIKSVKVLGNIFDNPELLKGE